MTTMDAARLNIPRWMVLAMPEDVDQIVALVRIEYRTPAQQRAAMMYYLRELRRTQWDRRPSRRARKPACLRPSKRASGYRRDPEAHKNARMAMTAEQRRAIARKGAQARWIEETSFVR